MAGLAAVPSVAGVHNYLLGGTANFAADRALGDRLEELFPGAGERARDARRFLLRAVTYVAWGGVADFVDLGAGIPAGPRVDQVARTQIPRPRVVYVDHDPVVTAYGSVLDGRAGIAVCEHDIRDPSSVLADTRLRRLVRLRAPACVIFSMVLHLMTALEAAAAVAGFTARLPAGSYVIISCAAPVPAVRAADVAAVYTAAPMYLHDRQAVTGFLAGLDLVPPGVVDVRSWWPGAAGDLLPAPRGMILGAVARTTAGPSGRWRSRGASSSPPVQ